MDEIAKAFEKIKARVKRDADGCWIWQGGVNGADMYGGIRVGAKVMSTHRVAYTAVKGPIPRGKVVRHRCDVRLCCNPEHLIVGDHEDNTQDIVDRQRHKQRRKLSADECSQVIAMRRAGHTKRAIAEALQCNWYAVSRALDASGIDVPGRLGRPKGSRNLRPRVSAADKDRMRALYATGKFTQQALAEKFHCDQTYVSLLVRKLQ